MNDKLLFSDGDTLYITLLAKVNPVARVSLIMLNALVYLGLLRWAYYLAITVDPFAPTLAVIAAFLVFLTLTKVTLWNMYGREIILISPDSFSYQFDYGWFKSSLKTYDIPDSLWLNREDTWSAENNELVYLHFFRSFPGEEQIYHFYSSNLRVSEDIWMEIDQRLKAIFDRQWPEELLN